MKTQLVLFALLATAVLLAGCLGGGSQINQSNGTTTPVTTPNATQNQTQNGGGSNDAASQLASLFAGAGQPNYKVTYTFTIGQGTAATPATMIMYKKGDKQRTDTNIVVSGMTVSSEMFLLDNNTYVCSSYGDQGFTCMKSSSQASPMPSATTCACS